jgi:mevalonate pyrophosphate decarboxylase
MKKRNKMSEVTDVVKALHQKQHLHDEIRKYFYYDSALCRALQDYLEKDLNPHCFLKHGRRVINSSAHSGVHFNDAFVCTPMISNGPKTIFQPDQLVFKFNIDLIDSSEREDREDVSVSVPGTLETHFSKAKFDKWVKQEKEKRVKQTKEHKDEKTILKIAMKYDIPIDAIKHFLSYL